MNPSKSKHDLNVWFALFLAISLAVVSFLIQGRVGFSPADEGFLWYGVQRTIAGEIPLRDFQSYEPGRYYWCAAGSLVFGSGLVALRISETIAQVFGLWLGLLAASRLTRNWVALSAIGFLLTIWMFPSHKVFDHALLLAGIWIATRVVEKPVRARIIVAGLFVGFCIFFGKNHALYQGSAQLVLLLLLFFKRRRAMPRSWIVSWSLGLALGLLPLIAMLLCVHGFLAAYELSIAEIFRHGTNLALPFPWPWLISFSGDSWGSIAQVLLGSFLIAMPLVYLAGLGAYIFSPTHFLEENPLFAGSSAVGLFYLHHVYSRTDLSHLAQAVHPFLFCLLAVPFFFSRQQSYLIATAGLLIVVGYVAVLTKTPAYRRLVSPVPWLKCDLGGNVLVPPREKQLFEFLRKFEAENISAREGVLVAPSSPGLYSILGRVSPLWEIYFLFPAADQQQQEMIHRLANKNVNWAIVSNAPTDGRQELRFSMTHSLVWKYLQENFEPIPPSPVLDGMAILHRKLVSREAPGPDSSLPSVR